MRAGAFARYMYLRVGRPPSAAVPLSESTVLTGKPTNILQLERIHGKRIGVGLRFWWSLPWRLGSGPGYRDTGPGMGTGNGPHWATPALSRRRRRPRLKLARAATDSQAHRPPLSRCHRQRPRPLQLKLNPTRLYLPRARLTRPARHGIVAAEGNVARVPAVTLRRAPWSRWQAFVARAQAGPGLA